MSFLNGFKNIPGKACVNRVHNNYTFANVGIKHTRKTPHTNRRMFIDIKSLHVMIIDHLIGQWAYELLMSF